ncbi:unnamed protein product [Effrenium voratum]|nr:unnamed protein product [Effrenium voratum]
MGAAEGVLREHSPLLPEARRTRHSLADVKAARSRTSTSSGTLLSTMANLPKAKPGITLPTSPPSKCTTVDSDLSTTDATSRSQDYDSDGFAEENLPSPMLSPSHQDPRPARAPEKLSDMSLKQEMGCANISVNYREIQFEENAGTRKKTGK